MWARVGTEARRHSPARGWAARDVRAPRRSLGEAPRLRREVVPHDFSEAGNALLDQLRRAVRVVEAEHVVARGFGEEGAARDERDLLPESVREDRVSAQAR